MRQRRTQRHRNRRHRNKLTEELEFRHPHGEVRFLFDTPRRTPPRFAPRGAATNQPGATPPGTDPQPIKP